MEHRTELLRLLSSLCDEQITEAEQARLEELLADGEARRLYVQYLDMHARLLTHPSVSGDGKLTGVDALAGVIGEAVAVERAVHDSQAERHRGRSLQRIGHRGRSLQRFWRFVRYAGVAAATVAATILVQLMLSQPRMAADTAQSPPLTYVATLSQAANVEWGAATQAYRPGARV